MTRFIFIAGGVMSGVGKGVATASIGKILKSKRFKVSAIKIDPYINVDAGTMNPVEHGEVFVTDDGVECDQDVGHYERFLENNLTTDNYLTTGRVYQAVINRERNLEYGGRCVEVVPDIPNEVIFRIKKAAQKTKADFILIEIGGTVGEYQNMLFLEAARMMKLILPKRVLFVLVSYLPVPEMIGEMKTKPTQNAVKSLNEAGIQPDIILGRSVVPLDEPRKRKISIFCNMAPQDVISAPDVGSIYEVPVNFEKENLGDRILKKFGMKYRKSNLKDWKRLVGIIKNLQKPVNPHTKRAPTPNFSGEGRGQDAKGAKIDEVSPRYGVGVKIGVVGKYFETGRFTLMDSYISVIEAIKHACWYFKRKPEIHWLSSEIYEKNPRAVQELKKFDGIIVPGGFGNRGVEGKIKAVEFCRKQKIPYLGLCLGMQLAVIEFARNVVGLKKANSTEFAPKTPAPVIDVMPEQKVLLKEKRYGATMRLGAYKCELKKGSLSWQAYRRQKYISERHRHRYELNNAFREALESKGLVIAGTNPERDLVEIIEVPNHPFFVAGQFHPEFKSSPLNPHPLFLGLIKASIKRK